MTFDHIKEGLNYIARIKNGETTLLSWSREALVADLTRDEVKISFLWDESSFEKLALDEFEKALSAWLAFIQSPVRMDAHEEVLL